MAVLLEGCGLRCDVLLGAEAFDGWDRELAESGDGPECGGDASRYRRVEWVVFVEVV